MDKNAKVLADVCIELVRQEALREKGKFPFTCAQSGLTMPEKLAVLAEEFGEVSHEVTEAINVRVLLDGDLNPEKTEALYDELIQVAAVAVAWAESLK